LEKTEQREQYIAYVKCYVEDKFGNDGLRLPEACSEEFLYFFAFIFYPELFKKTEKSAAYFPIFQDFQNAIYKYTNSRLSKLMTNRVF
jgi:hypothetical protein